jgi:hypothetical protein
MLGTRVKIRHVAQLTRADAVLDQKDQTQNECEAADGDVGVAEEIILATNPRDSAQNNPFFTIEGADLES